MKRYHFYHKKTGIFTDFALTVTDKDHVEPNTPPDHVAFEGSIDIFKQRMDVGTGKLVEHLTAPLALPNLINMVHARVRHLEQEMQPRAIREALLGYDGALDRLKAIDDEIIKLRLEL